MSQAPVSRSCFGKRILVVDEDEDVLGTARDWLGKLNCVVDTAQRGADAIDKATHSQTGSRYDVILAAANLPDMSGDELYVRLRNLLDRVPMALMSGYGYDPTHTMVKARSAGMQPISVYKPLRMQLLFDACDLVVKLYDLDA